MEIISSRKFNYIVCPKCRKKLSVSGNTLKCAEGHSFDVASCGYVNLLPPHKTGDVPGDSKEMVRARRDFLSKGYYKPLADKLYEIIKGYKPEIIADIGCGEGYYTSGMGAFGAHVMGFDISKYALMYAAKRDKASDYCTANLHDIPLADNTADMAVCCFCAHDEHEFARILKENGKLITVLPAKRHLFGLKEILYDKPYENTEETETMECFCLVEEDRVEYTVDIDCTDDIMNLFSMTPYFWKTSKDGADRLKAMTHLNTELGFVIRTYVKR